MENILHCATIWWRIVAINLNHLHVPISNPSITFSWSYDLQKKNPMTKWKSGYASSYGIFYRVITSKTLMCIFLWAIHPHKNSFPRNRCDKSILHPHIYWIFVCITPHTCKLTRVRWWPLLGEPHVCKETCRYARGCDGITRVKGNDARWYDTKYYKFPLVQYPQIQYKHSINTKIASELDTVETYDNSFAEVTPTFSIASLPSWCSASSLRISKYRCKNWLS